MRMWYQLTGVWYRHISYSFFSHKFSDIGRIISRYLVSFPVYRSFSRFIYSIWRYIYLVWWHTSMHLALAIINKDTWVSSKYACFFIPLYWSIHVFIHYTLSCKSQWSYIYLRHQSQGKQKVPSHDTRGHKSRKFHNADVGIMQSDLSTYAL